MPSQTFGSTGTVQKGYLDMSLLRASKLFPLAFALAIGMGSASAQSFLTSDDARDTASTIAPAPAIAVQSTLPTVKKDSLVWVHVGVTAQLAGTFADWATSWKQPEGNSLLTQSSGQYAGRFYRSGTAVKFGIAGGVGRR